VTVGMDCPFYVYFSTLTTSLDAQSAGTRKHCSHHTLQPRAPPVLSPSLILPHQISPCVPLVDLRQISGSVSFVETLGADVMDRHTRKGTTKPPPTCTLWNWRPNVYGITLVMVTYIDSSRTRQTESWWSFPVRHLLCLKRLARRVVWVQVRQTL